MSNFLTPETASTVLCPLARTFGAEQLTAKFRGASCAVWRWLPPMADDPKFLGAIKREEICLAQEVAEETNQKAKPPASYHKKAVANVMRDPEAYGIPSSKKGWCGLGGKPE